MPETAVPADKLKVLIGRAEIARRVAEMGAEISRDFAGESLLLVGVLKGATVFLGDLARHIELDVSFDFIGVCSYGAGSQHSGEVRIIKDVDTSLEGRNVVLVEDILDTGLTLSFLKRVLSAHRPRVLKVAALLDKRERRMVPAEADYVGFSIPNEFIVGYGMDYAERYRGLADICVLPREVYQTI